MAGDHYFFPYQNPNHCNNDHNVDLRLYKQWRMYLRHVSEEALNGDGGIYPLRFC